MFKRKQVAGEDDELTLDILEQLVVLDTRLAEKKGSNAEDKKQRLQQAEQRCSELIEKRKKISRRSQALHGSVLTYHYTLLCCRIIYD